MTERPAGKGASSGKALRPSAGPLHRQIYRELRHEIARDYRPGDVLPSQNELAERFKVSFMTVREALSILVEEGVIERHRGRETIVVDPAANQHVGVLLELDIAHPRTSYHFRCLVQQLRRSLHERGYAARAYLGLIAPGEDTQDEHLTAVETTCPELLADLDAGRLRGLVVVGGISPLLARRLHDAGLPVVGQEERLSYVVNYALEDEIRLGIDYLVAQGRRRLAFMSWNNPTPIIRYARQVGLEVHVDWLRCDLPPAAPAAGWEEFREIWSARREKPDGLLITDDMLFGDALHAMIDVKVQVPDELMVVTHAVKGVPFWAPFPVTRLEYDPRVTADAMASMLSDLLERREPKVRRQAFAPTLVEPGTPVTRSDLSR